MSAAKSYALHLSALPCKGGVSPVRTASALTCSWRDCRLLRSIPTAVSPLEREERCECILWILGYLAAERGERGSLTPTYQPGRGAGAATPSLGEAERRRVRRSVCCSHPHHPRTADYSGQSPQP